MLRVSLWLRLLACACLLLVPMASLNQWFYDLFFRMRVHRTTSSEVVLVRVNDSQLFEKLSDLEPRFSSEKLPFDPSGYAVWYDEFYSGLIQRLQSAKPRLIVFATYYDWVHVTRRPRRLPDGLVFSATLNAEHKLIPPPRALTEEPVFGFNNVFPDGDGVIRKTYLVYSSIPSLALRIFQSLGGEKVRRNLLDPMWIDYRGKKGHYPTYDATALVNSTVEISAVTGKVVFVGREESVVADVATPVGRMSKMEVLANSLETFLQKREIRMLPPWASYFAPALCIVFSAWVILTLPLNVSWLLLIFFAGFVLLFALIAFVEFKLWFGVGNPLLCILGSHLLLIGYRLRQQEEGRWRLEQESQYLKEMDEFKNNFISLFSHDLKTPIAKIKAITDRLLGEHSQLPDSTKESLRTLERANGELARFISDILKVTKMETMSLSAAQEVVDLNRLVEEAVARLKFHADQKGIEIVCDLEPLFSMEGDQKLLIEVIINLLENAIKYSPHNKKIIVRTREESVVVRVSVIDEGPGIDPAELPRVTSKFYRGKAAASTSKGSGLGLYLAKYFVELHKGTLKIESSPDAGTTASFTLPIPP